MVHIKWTIFIQNLIYQNGFDSKPVKQSQMYKVKVCLNKTGQERFEDCLTIYFWPRSFHILELINWPNILVSKPNDFDNFCSCLAILFVQSLFSWCEWSSWEIGTYMNTKTYSMNNFREKMVSYIPFHRCHKPT